MRLRNPTLKPHTLALAVLALCAAPSVWAQACRPGTFSASGLQPCTPAPLGHYVEGFGATAPTPAMPGFFVDGVGRTSATAAPRGFYVAAAAASAPSPAQPGCFVPGMAFTSCTPAARGHYVPTAAAVDQTPAAPGCYVPTFGASTCTPAARGFYVPTSAAVEPTPAMPGTYVPTTGATSATLARPGCYVPGTAHTVCTPAAIGHYVPRAGAIEQTPAPVGRYVSIVGAAAASDCPTGTSSYGGSEACRITSDRASAGPPAVGPVWLSTLGDPGRAVDVGRVTGPLLLGVSWENATRDLGYASLLTRLTLRDATLGGRDAAWLELVGAMRGVVDDFGGGGQRFEIHLRDGAPLGDFAVTLNLFTDIGADPGRAGELLSYRITGTVVAIPEPGTWALWLAGLAAVAGMARHRRPRLGRRDTASG